MAPFLNYLWNDNDFIKDLETNVKIEEGTMTSDQLFLIYDSCREYMWNIFSNKNIYTDVAMMVFKYFIYDLCDVWLDSKSRSMDITDIRCAAISYVKYMIIDNVRGSEDADIQSIISGITPVNEFRDLLTSIGFRELFGTSSDERKPRHSFIIKVDNNHIKHDAKDGYRFVVNSECTSFEICKNNTRSKKSAYPDIPQSLFINFNSIQQIVEVFSNDGDAIHDNKLQISVGRNYIENSYRNFCKQEPYKKESLLRLEKVLNICDFISNHYYMKNSIDCDIATIDADDCHFYAYRLTISNEDTRSRSIRNIYFMFELLKSDLDKFINSGCFMVYTNYIQLKK